ncbi:MAG: APC family permease [Bacteroidota bacterium]|nr:APC family permease [Bacteroidota bacterium]
MKSGTAQVPQFIRKISVLPLAAVIFFTVSGGPYGLEPLIGYAGNYAIPLLMITPLLWDIPMILVVLELNSMMPVEGGYYEWVKRGLGIRWAFMEGWWSWLYSFVDLAIYPVFFVEYAAFFFPQIEMYKTPVCLAVVWLIAALNIRGIVPVGRTALFLTVAMMIPFLILYYTGFLHPVYTAPATHHGMTSLSMALFTIMWNCIGWDNATTYAGEVKRPIRSYLTAILLAFACVYLFYISFTYLALRSGIPGTVFAEKGIPYLGTLIGGNSLGGLLSIGGMASMLGIFSAVMLSVSRVPAVMGRDKLLPQKFTRLHSKYQTPYISIIVCSCIVSVLILRSLADLLIMDICLYTAGISLEFVALIRLRKTAATEDRPFRIPLQMKGLIGLCLAPVLVFSVALGGALMGSAENLEAAVIAILAIISAPVAWLFVGEVKRNKGKGII